MFFLRKPAPGRVDRFISTQRELSFTYAEVGATRGPLPQGYIIDHNQVRLGEGRDIFERAVAALRRWRQFDLGWVSAVPITTPIEVGATVAIRAQTLGVWSLSASRIVYLIDDEAINDEAGAAVDRSATAAGTMKRWGFAYGTLPDHVESGEERFMIKWLTDDSVWYELLAFSRPNQLLVRLGYPYARSLQKRFARDSKQSMLRAVALT
jgi:uncharacterized protein (UPF0548 family)